MAAFYGANDPAALELQWLIPLVALTALIEGLRSPRVLSAARHMRVAQITRIEIAVTIVNTTVLLSLAWYLRSVYALAISAVLSSALHAALTYWFLPGARARFVLGASCSAIDFLFRQVDFCVHIADLSGDSDRSSGICVRCIRWLR